MPSEQRRDHGRGISRMHSKMSAVYQRNVFWPFFFLTLQDSSCSGYLLSLLTPPSRQGYKQVDCIRDSAIPFVMDHVWCSFPIAPLDLKRCSPWSFVPRLRNSAVTLLWTDFWVEIACSSIGRDTEGSEASIVSALSPDMRGWDVERGEIIKIA